ncbi:hypothetical protein OK016_21355 [Vibrio chagasii]|nr:hypothetical protein [Vibrio chagasii]
MKLFAEETVKEIERQLTILLLLKSLVRLGKTTVRLLCVIATKRWLK